MIHISHDEASKVDSKYLATQIKRLFCRGPEVSNDLEWNSTACTILKILASMSHVQILEGIDILGVQVLFNRSFDFIPSSIERHLAESPTCKSG